jgi:3D (Asp-Asp-Asp) domain-containing protein
MNASLLPNSLWFRRSTIAVVACTLALVSISAGKETAKAKAKVASDNVIAPIELMHDIAAPTSTSIKLPHVRTLVMQVTAYCPCQKCCGPNAHGITASGKDITYNDGRFVAADTRSLPFGTRLVIPGYHNTQPVEVIDRGGAIKGDKLDVFFPTHEEALKWGRQTVEVTIID